MKPLVISGCSFVECWHPTQSFVDALGCDSAVNLGRVGGSNQRSFRTVIEWIAQNGDPGFVIVPITYITRFEMAISNREDPIDGAWFPIQRYELIEQNQDKILGFIDQRRLKDLIDLTYAVTPDTRTYWDRLFTEMIMFAGFLRSRSIPYLMFDMVNAFDPADIKIYQATEKVRLLEQDPRIIDLWKFVGNRYMWETMSEKQQSGVDPLHHHHSDPQYAELERYLVSYIQA